MQIQKKYEFKEINLPTHLVNFLEQKNGLKRKFDFDKFSVTEIIQCKRKSFYKKTKQPQENMITENIGDMWSTVRGNFLHQMTSAYTWNELESEMTLNLPDGHKISLMGRLDMYDPQTQTILDLKTTVDVKSQAKKGLLPKKEHILQLQCYYTIFSKIIPVKNLNLVYADMSDLITYDISLRDMTFWMEQRISEISNSVDTGMVPKGEVSSKCKFCKFQTACYNKKDGILENPLSIPKNYSQSFKK